VTDVAHVITRMIVGGAQENTLYSAAGLAARPDYRVVLATGPETGTEGNLLARADAGVEVVYIPHLVRAIRPDADALAVGEMYRLFARRRPDVVHTHSSKAGVLGRVAARAARVPLVVHTLHSLVFHDYQAWAVNRSYRTIKRTLVPLTDHYVSVSDNIRERAIAAGIGRPERHSTVRSGFDTAAFVSKLVPRPEARAQLGLPDDRVVVGVVARLFPLKGHGEILKAARRLVGSQPDVLFVFAGGGPLQAALEREVAESGLGGHVRFLGRVAPEDIPSVFSCFDILAHASLREGLARVIPQGVLAGLPVVCYDLDGSSEVVTDGVNGFLVAPRDTNALADRLGALAGDDALRKRLGGAGRDRIGDSFSIERMVGDLDELYTRLLAGRAVTRSGAGDGAARRLS
jgi:glycosyltransferase involved in cell wall biosynthesis